MVDLTPALGASAGIPQSLRQTTCLLAQSPHWSTSALVMSLHEHGHADHYTKKRSGFASLMDDAEYLDDVLISHESDKLDAWREVKRFFRRTTRLGYPLIPFKTGQFTDVIWEHYFAPGLPASFRGTLDNIRFYRSPLLRPEATRQLRSNFGQAGLKTKGIDALIFQNPTPIQVSAGTTKIIRLHDLFPLLRFDTQPKARYIIRDFGLALSYCVKDSYFACVSEPVREAFLSLYPHVRHRTSVIPISMPLLGRADNATAAPPDERDTFFLAVGTVEPRKNYCRLIQGFRLYRQTHGSNRRLVIVGSHGWRNEKEIAAITKAQKEGWLTWYEQIPPDDLTALYQQSLALVGASVNEGFGMPPLEAAALGTPSVLSDLPVFRLNMGDAAEYFDPLFPESLAEALARMTPGRRAELAPLARKKTQLFRPENELAHWQELIREVTHTREIPISSPVRVTSLQPRDIVSSCPFTVVISCEKIDQRFEDCLARIAPQAKATRAEVLVGVKAKPGDERERWPTIKFFYDADGTVLSLRAQGISEATGEVVAVTEDHGAVGPDWCELLIDCHRTHPEAAIIYGPVRHDGPYGIVSWANFFIIFGLVMPPILFAPRRRTPPIVNVSIKRSYLPEQAIEAGWFEFVGIPTFHDLGLCRYDNRIVVGHIQHHGFLGTYSSHFHNARVTTGSRKLSLGSPQWWEHLSNTFYVPIQLIFSDWKTLWAKGQQRGLLLATLPSYALIALSHMLGEITGLFFGSGRSAEHLD